MIVGSGLLARAFYDEFARRDDVCIYAAGVSNSASNDSDEFLRERQCLGETLQKHKDVEAFVYFGTCSVYDPTALKTPYVQHKLSMEEMVLSNSGNIVLRLPQVAGNTPNPHTLLNYLYSCISQSIPFKLWSKAERNIIDVDDVASLAKQVMTSEILPNSIINIANTNNYSVLDIVDAFEKLTDRQAIYDVVEHGSVYEIETDYIYPLLEKAGVKFDAAYLDRTIKKYYSKRDFREE